MQESVAFDGVGRPILTCDFDWASIEVANNLAVEREQINQDILAGRLSKEDFDRTFQLFQTLLRWSWSNGMHDIRGLGIRSLLIHWIALEELRPLTLTELAKGTGVTKQRLSYVKMDLEKNFPALRGCNLPFAKEG